MSQPLRVGVIGLGVWGRVHLEVIASHPNSELAAVCDTDGERAYSVAAAKGVPAFTDHVTMLCEVELDAVHVVTPERAHHDSVIAAAHAGVSVLCEKPMAPTTSECTAMIEAADAAGVTLMVDFHNRWNPPYALLKERLDGGELGRVIYGHLKHSDTKVVPREMVAWTAETSILWYVGCHLIDLVRWLLDDEVRRVDGRVLSGALRDEGIDADDAYLALIEMAGGSTFVLESSWCLPDAESHFLDPRIDVVGTDGSAYISVIKNTAMQMFTQDRGFETPDLLVAPSVHGQMKGYATESIGHFLDCLSQGRSPMVTGQDGRAATQAIEAILESIARSVPVELS